MRGVHSPFVNGSSNGMSAGRHADPTGIGVGRYGCLGVAGRDRPLHH
jgi:hypothetical protein